MTSQLAGKRILIIEDEPAIAGHLAFQMTAEGAEVIGPVASADAALDEIANTHNLDGATLDIKLLGKMTFAVADALAAHNIPFVFLTGYRAQDVPARYSNVPCCEKPLTPAAVCHTLEAVLSLPQLDKPRTR
jgi:DNA-binding response OmpR family regulator